MKHISKFSKVVDEDGVKRLYIDFTPDGMGLGSKIKAVISNWRLHPEINELSLYCPTGEYWDAKFSELFDFPIVDRLSPAEGIDPSKWIFLLTHEEKTWLRDQISKKPVPPEIIAMEEHYAGVPKELRDKFLVYFNRLQFKKEIYERANAVLKNTDLSEAIGVLVREKDYIQYNRHGSYAKYVQYIDKLSKYAPIVLCCQSTETLNKFKKEYGTRIIAQSENYDVLNSERMKEVAVNMVLLSKCPNMIGNYGSCFMEAAWYYGGCKASVKKVLPWNL